MSGTGFLCDRCPYCRMWLRRASAAQHGAMQAVLEDIALQVHWPPKSGRLIGVSKWWQLIISAFDRHLAESEEAAELLPAIDGYGFDGNGFDFVRGPRLRRRLNSAEIGEIIEYARAWAIQQYGVKFREFEKRAA